MNSCQIVHENLFAYTEGSLPDAIKGQFDAHISGCTECANVLSGFYSLLNTIDDQKSIEPRPFAETRILQGIESRLEASRRSRIPVFNKVLQPAIISIGIAAAIAIGLFIGYEGANVRHELNRQKTESVRTDLNLPDMIYEESYTFTE